MSKAILVIDMPESCRKCPLHEMSVHFDKYLCVPMGKLYDKFVDKKPSWCPLREVPEKKDTTSIHPELHEVDVRLGYNKCIDEILGKEV